VKGVDYSQFAVDCGKQIAGMLKNDVDFMAMQKGLTGVMNIPMPDISPSILENLQLDSTGVIANLCHQMLNVDLVPLTATFANTIVEQLNGSAYQNMASQWAVGLLESIQDLPIVEFEARQEIPAEEVQEVLTGVKSCLPEEAIELVDAKVKEAQTADKKISNSDWIAIIGIIVTILLFIVDQCSSVEHEQKEEAAWSAFAEYQQESIELQKQDLTLKQEILDCLKNRNEVAAETQDASVNALEVAQEDFEGAVDVADLPDNSQEQETLDKAGDAEN
jgi:uncharacterized protein YdcH (DUF465 family)